MERYELFFVYLPTQIALALIRLAYTCFARVPRCVMPLFLEAQILGTLFPLPFRLSSFQTIEISSKVSATIVWILAVVCFSVRCHPLSLQARGVVDAVCALHDANHGEVITTEVKPTWKCTHSHVHRNGFPSFPVYFDSHHRLKLCSSAQPR